MSLHFHQALCGCYFHVGSVFKAFTVHSPLPMFLLPVARLGPGWWSVSWSSSQSLWRDAKIISIYVQFRDATRSLQMTFWSVLSSSSTISSVWSVPLGFPFWSSSQKPGVLFILLLVAFPVTAYFLGRAAEQRMEKAVGFTLPL